MKNDTLPYYCIYCLQNFKQNIRNKRKTLLACPKFFNIFQVISALLELHRLESSGFTAREEAAFQRMCSLVAHDLLPHINKCLLLLYPLQQISQITGISVNQLQKEVSQFTGA